MPITIDEKFESRQSTTGANASVDLIYVVRGSDDDLAIKSAVDAATPDEYDNLDKQSISIEPIAPEVWEATVRYADAAVATSSAPQTGESTFSFDTGGGTQHITQSLATVGTYAAAGLPGAAPDFQGAIGVSDPAGGVEGVDITVPVYQFSETHYISPDDVTLAYRGKLCVLTGKVNAGSFKGLAAGECLFLGAVGTQRGSGDWEITFRFAASPNRSNFSLGGITGINKKGWEYLWVRYADVEDTAAKMLIKRPIAVYVEKVYEEADFSQLGIGT